MNPEELKRIAVLREMDADARARLAAVLEERSVTDGNTVFHEGDAGDSMYFIVEGCVRIEKRTQAAEAAHKVLAVLEAGDYFGEMALLEQKPRSARAVAAGATRVLRLSKEAFHQLRETNSLAATTVLFSMIRVSSERIRRLSTELIVYDEVGKAIGEATDLRALLDAILRQLAGAGAADWSLLVLRSLFSDQLEICAQSNLDLTPAQREAVIHGEGFLGRILRDGQDLLVGNLAEDEWFKSSAQLGFETVALVAAPISLKGECLGVIALGARHPGQFDRNLLNLIRGVARQAGQAILNARHREEELARSKHSRQYVRF